MTSAPRESVTLFAGGFLDPNGVPQWAQRFGTLGGDRASMAVVAGVPIEGQPEIAHAEAQLKGVIGVDFTYSAYVTVHSAVDSHLQFRVSDEGRYGIRLRTDGIVFYRFLLEDRQCSSDPTVFAHCPDWPPPGCFDHCDDPQWSELGSRPLALASDLRHLLTVTARGQDFDVFLDGAAMLHVTDGSLAVGRFGVYVWGAAAQLSQVVFDTMTATTDPTQASNFALLYSTAGYEAGGTKRALIRTLNELPMPGLDPDLSRFTVTRSDGVVVLSGALRGLPALVREPDFTVYLPAISVGASFGPPELASHPATLMDQRLNANRVATATTFGMQLWEADFSTVSAPGTYSLRVEVATATGAHTLQSAPFEIGSHLVSTRMLKPLTILNAEARRAADEDMRRNWIKRSGAWSVGVDGAFIADRADAGAGAVLDRVFNGNNTPLNELNFRLVGQITIVGGCDAQFQFRITPTERWAVTLQAGNGGGCSFSGGPGAVRLHREGVDGFHIVAATLFPAEATFRAGQRYDVEILAVGSALTVYVDGVARLVNVPISGQPGGFALKAWASTVRFERVQAWHPAVRLKKSPDGERIPYYWNGISCQGSVVEAIAFVPDGTDDPALVCNPMFSQLHGFHDANNLIGEATSHGAFLAGLMPVWTTRASTMSMADREGLRRAIVGSALYLETLYQEAYATGEFAHSEMGRSGVNGNLGPWQSQIALYGESAFADRGKYVDNRLARQACERSIQGARWLAQHGQLDAVTQSVIYPHLARCVRREQLSSGETPQTYWDMAFAAVEVVLSQFAAPGGIEREFRDAGRVIPWFEGVYEVLQEYPEKQTDYTPRLNAIADTLVNHLTQEHPCDEAQPNGPRCAANGFFVLPQASGDPAAPVANWQHMEGVPLVDRPTTLPFVHAYTTGPFAVATSDMVYIGLITGRNDVERVATGNYYWILGLNPGAPAAKIVHASGSGPWQATSFVYNLAGPFARTIEGFRTQPSSSKGWMAPWEVSTASPHRETWWIDPLNNGFQSIVNGTIIWDRQWDYWNVGREGWSSGETFILYDGAFVKGALLLEDWLGPAHAYRLNPYDTTRLGFFDTTHVDRVTTGWAFDAPDTTLAASAARAATNFCNNKGYNGGRFTGHYLDERVGVACVSSRAVFFDTTPAQIAATGWNFSDINSTPWAQVARAATGFCNSRGYAGGFFTGHQVNGLRGVVCLPASDVRWFDATEQDLYNSGEGFGDINTVNWAKAARGATNICLGKGFAGGFFTGHQLLVNNQTPYRQGVVCFVP